MQLAAAGFDLMEVGEYPSLYTPIQEMTCIRPPKPTGGWYEPVNTAGGGWGKPHWEIREEDGANILVQTREESKYDNLILVKGDTAWHDYTVSARIKTLEAPLRLGVIFRYQTSLNYYAAVLVRDTIQVIRRRQDECTVLASAPCEIPEDVFELKAEISLAEFRIAINGKELLTIADTELEHGKAGIYAWSRAEFHDFNVECGDEEAQRLNGDKKENSGRLRAVRESFPAMKRSLEIDIKGFTGGKLFRFGDLTGNGELDILLGMAGAKHGDIKCLTAINQQGEILWRKGSPIDEVALITSDFPVQIVDFDGDGKNEVLTVWDGKFVVLDGATGEEIRSGDLPRRPPRDETPVHVHGTSWFGECLKDTEEPIVPKYIRPCNLTGRAKGKDFICGYGYPFLWGFDNDFNQMWQFTGNVGHFAYAYDADGDGMDEIQAGYCRLKGDGTWLFSLHQGDHADAVFFSNNNHPQGDDRLMIYASGGDDGLLMFDDQGYFKPLKCGHAQRLSIGKYRADVPGYQMAVITYWGNPGICYMYDRWGTELWSREMPVAGSNLNPVNWTGEGTELMLFSAHRDIGGLLDAQGELVVPFPDRDHPELWCESMDFFQNGRDDIVTMDRDRIVVYSPEDDAGKDVYRPDRPPFWAWSNFMANFSMKL
ncbi:hypothetical protein ACFL4W_05120 [Planctomycetota bacterium]